MIFVTVGTTKFSFPRLFSALDNFLISSHSHEKLIVKSPLSYNFKYPYVKVFPDLPFPKIISYYKKSRISIVHGGMSSIYLATKYCHYQPIIVPRYIRYSEHTNNNQFDYCQIIKHQKNTNIVFDSSNFPKQLQQKIQHPILINSGLKHKINQTDLTINLTKYTNNISSHQNIIIVFNRLIVGGVEIKIVDIINKLFELHAQYHVTLLLRDNNISPIILAKINAPFTLICSPKTPDKISKNILFPFFLSFYFLKLQPVTILSFMDISSIASVIAKHISHVKSKLIISEDINIIKHIQSQSFPNLRRFLISRLYSQASKIIALTRYNFNNLIKLGVNPQKISVIPNWLPYATTSNLLKARKYQKQKKYDLLFVGRLDQQKNPFDFLKICQMMPTKKALIIGNGPLLLSVTNKIKKMKIKNVTLIKETNKIYRYYQQSKILLLTSKYEGCPPLVVLEAIVQNCLPVVPNIPDINWFFSEYQKKLIYSSLLEAKTNIDFLLGNNTYSQKILRYYSKLILSKREDDLSLLFEQIINQS